MQRCLSKGTWKAANVPPRRRREVAGGGALTALVGRKLRGQEPLRFSGVKWSY